MDRAQILPLLRSVMNTDVSTLTLRSIRGLLEASLGMKEGSLDAHKDELKGLIVSVKEVRPPGLHHPAGAKREGPLWIT
jgi:hypothetical protein